MVFELQVHCDATIAFPLLVSQTFAPRVKLEGYERSSWFWTEIRWSDSMRKLPAGSLNNSVSVEVLVWFFFLMMTLFLGLIRKITNEAFIWNWPLLFEIWNKHSSFRFFDLHKYSIQKKNRRMVKFLFWYACCIDYMKWSGCLCPVLLCLFRSRSGISTGQREAICWRFPSHWG